MTLEQLRKDLESKHDFIIFDALKEDADYTHTIVDTDRRFLSKLTVQDNSIFFNGTVYDDTDSLLSAINAYNATLPFVPAYYDPNTNLSSRTTIAIHEHIKKTGLKPLTGTDYSNAYVLNDIYGRPIIKLSFEMDDHWDTESGVIYDLLVNRCELIFSKFNNAEEAIKAINSMIESKCLTDIALQMKLLDGVSDKKDYNLIKMTDTENDTTIDLKSVIKKRMQVIINTL